LIITDPPIPVEPIPAVDPAQTLDARGRSFSNTAEVQAVLTGWGGWKRQKVRRRTKWLGRSAANRLIIANSNLMTCGPRSVPSTTTN